MNKKVLLVVLSLSVIGLITYIVVMKAKSERELEEARTRELELQKMLLEKYGESREVITKEIDLLMEKYSEKPETIKNLTRAKELYEDSHTEEAVRKLVVIVENKLKEKLVAEKDSWFESLTERNKKLASLKKMKKRATDLEWLDDLQSSILESSIDIRDKESHHEGFKDRETKAHICLLGTIEIIDFLVPKKELVEAE